MSVVSPIKTACCIHRVFEEQVRKTPQATAVIFEGQSLSYAALNQHANRLARTLRQHGVGAEALVGVCLHSSPEMVIAILGIWKAGGAYLPLDPAYPAGRLAFMREDSQITVLVTQEALAANTDTGEVRLVFLDTDGPALTPQDDDNPPDDPGPDSLAYVIYTSGSTGQPKGVEIAHRGIHNNLEWRQAEFHLTDKDALLQTYSFSFDPSVWAFFWPLTSGAVLVLPRPGGSGDPAYLVDTISSEQITVVGFSPSLLSVILERPDIGRCTSLRHVFCGGEPLTPTLVSRFHARLDAKLHNVYGPTEATIDATWWTCDRTDDGRAIPIGHSLPQTKTYVLDDQGIQVAPGLSGELYLAGVGLARGYRHRPDLTSEKFIPNPFGKEAFPTLYCTGDLARYRPDGALEYLGRIDQQVKIRGFRIELGEIESALVGYPGIRQAVVIVREDHADDRRLVAYLVANQNPPPPVEALEEHLLAALPAHMLPGAMVFLPEIPLTANGKADTAQLPRPHNSNRTITPPSTPIQRQLVTLFEELLHIDSIGIHDSFFALGGHSLLAAQLVERIEHVYDRKVPLAVLRDATTVAELALYLETQQASAVQSPLIERLSGGSERPLFFWHGSFTGGLYTRELSRLLGSEQPLFAIAPHGSEGTAIPPTIEAMAAEYITLIRAAQPSGPYRLAGFCNGGLVAYEAARQLRAQGQEVEFLALIEMYLPPTQFKLYMHDVTGCVGQLFRRTPQARLNHSLSMQSSAIGLLLALKQVRKAVTAGMRALRRDTGPNWDALIPEAYRNTAALYNLRPYDRPVCLFASKASSRQTLFPPETGWRGLVSSLTIDIIPGDHYGTLGAHLPDLVAHLQARLNTISVSK